MLFTLFGQAFLKVGLHKHGVFQIGELPADARQGGIDTRIA